MNKVSRKDRFKGLDKMGKELETIESMQEMVELYQKDIKARLDSITTNKNLQRQIKHELGFTD